MTTKNNILQTFDFWPEHIEPHIKKYYKHSNETSKIENRYTHCQPKTNHSLTLNLTKNIIMVIHNIEISISSFFKNLLQHICHKLVIKQSNYYPWSRQPTQLSALYFYISISLYSTYQWTVFYIYSTNWVVYLWLV